MVDIHIGMNNLDAATAAAIAYGNITRRKHKVYEKLARGYRDVGQLKKSIHYFEQVVAVNQSDVALLDFAEVLFKVGRHEEAHKLVAQAKRRHFDHAPAKGMAGVLCQQRPAAGTERGNHCSASQDDAAETGTFPCCSA